MADRELIDALVADLHPVRFVSPWSQATRWLATAALLVLALTFVVGVHDRVPERLQDWRFVLSLAAMVMTGVLGALAAFHLAIPDRSSVWLLIPGAPAIVWLGTVSVDCLTDWIALEPGSITLNDTMLCFATVTVVSTPLLLLLTRMASHAATIRPISTMVSGAIAIAALAAVALSLVHVSSATVLILAWNFGVAAVLLAISAIFARPLLVEPRRKSLEPARFYDPTAQREPLRTESGKKKS